MKELKTFDISFVGLREGVHQFEYLIEKTFFDTFNYDEFHSSKVQVNLTFVKKATLFELHFAFIGWIEVACDVTNELFKQTIETELDLVVKFGEDFNNENEALLIIPYSDYKINIAQYIYEATVLAVPIKRVHPGVNDGTLQCEALEKLKEFELKGTEQEQQKNTMADIDPRWQKLKEINSKKYK